MPNWLSVGTRDRSPTTAHPRTTTTQGGKSSSIVKPTRRKEKSKLISPIPGLAGKRFMHFRINSGFKISILFQKLI